MSAGNFKIIRMDQGKCAASFGNLFNGISINSDKAVRNPFIYDLPVRFKAKGIDVIGNEPRDGAISFLT